MTNLNPAPTPVKAYALRETVATFEANWVVL
jgi:hypothetical protein